MLHVDFRAMNVHCNSPLYGLPPCVYRSHHGTRPGGCYTLQSAIRVVQLANFQRFRSGFSRVDCPGTSMGYQIISIRMPRTLTCNVLLI